MLRRLLLLMVWTACGWLGRPSGATAEEKVDYLKQIKPLLAERCVACHGSLKQKGGLRLDTAALTIRGGKNGPAIRPGDPMGSLLLERVTSTEEAERMPPEGEPLTAEQIATIRRWIEQKAPAPADETPEADPRDHWAFLPRTRPAIPKLNHPDWAKNPIDAFIGQMHEKRGLTPQVEAPRELLVRRLYLDLLGVPPNLEEWKAIQADTRPDWYERLVDRLLEDPRHGERWARHWMDIWRYSDWWGLGDQHRNSQKHIWHWRDWIIESLNADLSYAEMVRLMLAADEIAPNDLGKLRATGFLARNFFLFNRQPWMEETVEHVSKALLGLTMNCVKCHDHKYDPFPQEDFYRMRAFFEPLQTRLEMLPGETDFARNGIPRVYDGMPQEPTYRFERGEEKKPDKSKVIPPGVPDILAFKPLHIQEIRLPIEAVQPERRAWVIENHRQVARQQVATAEANLAKLPQTASGRDRQLAELAVQLARLEQQRTDAIAAAMQATWAKLDAGKTPPAELVQAERAKIEAIVKLERQIAVSKARRAVIEVESRIDKLPADKKSSLDAELTKAKTALQNAEKAVDTPIPANATYTPFEGARWTATRFRHSGSDDPKMPFPAISTGRRTALADWMTDPRHPLTARVAVNHLWNRHFGTPLVATVFEFGRKGSPPTHPELLDWLASEFVDSGWSMKHIHRLIVTSATYRLSSSQANREANIAKDPDNRWWWRRNPIRVESQVVRDMLLALGGTLDTTIGGPPVLAAQQANSTRRSIYFFHSNNERNLFLTTFDEATVNECYRREQSIVPQQALALTNSQWSLDSAQRIAERLAKEVAATDDDAFIRRAFLLVLGASVQDAELAACRKALTEWRKLPNEANLAQARLVWVLLNHNDFVTLR